MALFVGKIKTFIINNHNNKFVKLPPYIKYPSLETKKPLTAVSQSFKDVLIHFRGLGLKYLKIFIYIFSIEVATDFRIFSQVLANKNAIIYAALDSILIF